MANFNLPYITEKRYLPVAPMLLTANGNSDGLIVVASTYRIKVGQILTFKSSSVPVKLAKVKRVISSTQFIVIGPKDSVTTINKLDMSMLLTADTATVELSEDRRPVIDLLEIQRQVYEEEPTVALRTHLVDYLGRSYDKANPVPVELSDGSISIGTVNAELEVQLSHQDNVPDVGDVHDSVRVGNGVYTIDVNSDGSINITDNDSSITVDGSVSVSNFPATQNVAITSSVELEIKNDSGNPVPVNGTVTANQGTSPWVVSVSSIPEIEIKNDSGNPVPVNGTVTANQGGTWNINNISGTVSLPTGASTSALQTTGNSSLSSINAKTPTLGQKNMAGSTPVVIASDQSAIPITDNNSSLTVDGSVSVSNFPATQNVAITSSVELEIKNDSGNPVPVNGTVTANQGTSPWVVSVSSIPEIEIKNDSGNPVPVNGTVTANQGTDPWNVNIASSVVTVAAQTATDAFGRLRVSEGFTLGDYKHTYGIDPNFRDTVINGATITHVPNQACARLATTSNSASYGIHQTKQYHNYMPGKSQLIKSTINFYSAVTNVTKRTGYFDDLNGIFFEQTGDGTLSFVIRTNTSGFPSDARRVSQAQWNIDTCSTSITGTSTDGSNFGKAGTWTLDITKTQIVFIDFQWLGVGRVRCGFVHNGQMVVAHEFYNSNHLPEVYMANPNLPVRCEIKNTGTTTGGYFDQICSTVISEGGYIESGIDWSTDSGAIAQSVPTTGYYPVMAIRLKNTFRGYPNRVMVRTGNINVYAENHPVYWQLVKLSGLSNITLSSPTWTSANADSAVEYTILGTAFTGGEGQDTGFVGTSSPGGSAKGTGTSAPNAASNAKKNFIAQNQDSSDSEIYVVACRAIGAAANVWVSVQWREIY